MPSIKLDTEATAHMRSFYQEELRKTAEHLNHLKSVLEAIGGDVPKIDIKVSGMNITSASPATPSSRTYKKAKGTTRKRKGNRPGPVSKWDKIITGILKEKDTPMTYEQLTDALMTQENRDLSQRKNTKATVTNTVFRLRKTDRLNTFSKGGRVKFVALMNWFDGDGSISENYLDKAQTTTRKNKKVVPAKKKVTAAAKTPAVTEAAPATKVSASKAPTAKASTKRKPTAKKAATKKPAAKKRTAPAAKK